MSLSKIDNERYEKVDKVLESLTIPDVVLHERVSDKKEPLWQMVREKLYSALREQDTSGAEYFEWLLEDFNNSKTVEEFGLILQRAYTDNGEAYGDDGYSFLNEKTDEDDYTDYSQ